MYLCKYSVFIYLCISCPNLHMISSPHLHLKALIKSYQAFYPDLNQFEKCSVFVSCQRRVGSGQPLGVCSASPTSRPPAASSNPSVGRPRLKAPPSLLATPTPWVSLTPAAWWGSRQQPAGHWGWLDFSEKCLRFFRACSETLRLPSRGVCLAWRRPAQPQDLVQALDCSDNPAQDLELLERR